MKTLYLKVSFLKKPYCAQSKLHPLGLRVELQCTLGTVEVILLLLLAGTCTPRRVAQVPLTLSNEVQDGLVISIHDQALLGRRVGALSSGVVWSAKRSPLSAVTPTGAHSSPHSPREGRRLHCRHSHGALGRSSWCKCGKWLLCLYWSEVEEGLSRTTTDGQQGPVMVAQHPACAEPREGRGFAQEWKFRKLLFSWHISAVQSRHLTDMVFQISIFTWSD